MQFNKQLLEALLQKYGNKEAPVPAPANGYNPDSGMRPALPSAIPPALPPTPAPTMPPVAAQPEMPPIASMPAPTVPTVASLPVSQPQGAPTPTAPAMPGLDPKYNDAARQQLYDQLAAKHQEGTNYAIAAGVGDMARRMGGSTGIDAQSKLQTQVDNTEKTSRDQFDEGRKANLEDLSSGLALKKAGREETEYQDQNNPNSQMSKLAVSLAQKYSPNEAKSNGWVPGKTSYADVIRVLPILERGATLEGNKSNRDMNVGLKQQQDDENRLAKLGDAMSTEKMRSGAVGQMSQSLAGIGKLKALMTGYKGDLTPQEWQEAAIAWNRVLTQGSAGGGEHSIEALVPHTLKGNIMGQIQWLTNNPTGTAQQEFSKRLAVGMDREEKYATQYVNKYKVGRLMDFQDVAGRKPDEVRMKLESQGIGFDDVSATNPNLAAKLWPKGSNTTDVASKPGSGWKVIR